MSSVAWRLEHVCVFLVSPLLHWTSGCACLGRMLAHGCGESTKPCGPGDEMEQPTHCPDRRRAGSPCPMRRALVSSHSVHTNEAGVPDRIRTPHTVALWGWAITRAKYLRGTASPPTSMSYCIPSALLVSASRVEMTGPRALWAAQCGLCFYLAYTRAIESATPLCAGASLYF